ncbi:MAG: asparaginase [Tissierellia bacterium]|nr:asparaginase [Tissierellia bacterium]
MLTIEKRNHLQEATHQGHIAVVGPKGLVASYGDPHYATFMRSSAKPVQVLPTLLAGLDKTYDLGPEEISIMSASHMGEPFHIETLLGIMEKTGLKEEDLLMKPTYPGAPYAREEAIRQGGKRKLYHNCSGKHLNLLLYHREKTGTTEGYYETSSPVFQAISEYLKRLSSTPKIETGVDGCGVPVFYVPIFHQAKLFLQLTNPELVEDALLSQAIEKVFSSVHAYPKHISGTDKICSIINEDPELFAKGGAKGIYCFGMKNPALGFAVKVEDGTADSWPQVVKELLRIYKPSSPTIAKLDHLFPSQITNDNDRVIGEHVTDFTLTFYE